jgi:hypothetical protein
LTVKEKNIMVEALKTVEGIDELESDLEESENSSEKKKGELYSDFELVRTKVRAVYSKNKHH